jgi:hypothetical protein
LGRVTPMIRLWTSSSSLRSWVRACSSTSGMFSCSFKASRWMTMVPLPDTPSSRALAGCKAVSQRWISRNFDRRASSEK